MMSFVGATLFSSVALSASASEKYTSLSISSRHGPGRAGGEDRRTGRASRRRNIIYSE